MSESPPDLPCEEQVNAIIAAWLEAARKAGKPIPQPRYRPVIYEVGP